MRTKELLKSEKIRQWIADVLKKPVEEIDKISDAYLELSAREQKILKHRFGLEDGVTHTLEETGKLFGVTRERIRQVETKALEKLRQFINHVD